MKINYETSNLKLIPFSENHVEFYYNWMNDEKIRYDTSTDNIYSLEEWKNIQKNWQNNKNMYSCIIHTKDTSTSIGDINWICGDYHSSDEVELMVMITEKKTSEKRIMLSKLYIKY